MLDHDSDVFFLTECHLKEGTPVKQLIPKGYKVAARRDRNQHGGGLLAGCKKHLLASELDLSKYNIKMEAELCGFELNGTDYILCYTSHSRFAVRLFDKMQQYVLDNPGRPTVFLGDFNIHNQEWLNSRSITDKGGSVAQEFCETFGFFQCVDFDTRDGNTLDLIMSPFDDSASAVANLGTSDHVSVRFTMHVTTLLEKQPAVLPVRDWAHAPWNHIRGAVKRALSYWDPSGCSSVDVAVDSLNDSLMCILDRYVPKAMMPGLPGPSPWWNFIKQYPT